MKTSVFSIAVFRKHRDVCLKGVKNILKSLNSLIFSSETKKQFLEIFVKSRNSFFLGFQTNSRPFRVFQTISGDTETGPLLKKIFVSRNSCENSKLEYGIKNWIVKQFLKHFDFPETYFPI